MQDKITEFFNQISNQNQVLSSGVSVTEQSQIYFNIPELEKYLEQP